MGLTVEVNVNTCFVTFVSGRLIWRFRNQSLFGSYQPRREHIFDDIVQMSFLWIFNRCKDKFSWNTWMQSPMFLNL